MVLRLKVTKEAKRAAKEALTLRKTLPESKRFGLDRLEAKKAGVTSGVQRAKQIIRKDSLSVQEAKRVASFYNRFKGCKTPKCEGALDLWGGRSFGRKADRFVEKLRK